MTEEIKRVLLPTDFSRSADMALSHALFLAGSYGAEIHLVHAVLTQLDDAFGPFPEEEELQQKLKGILSSALKKEFIGKKLVVKCRTLTGDSVSEMILNYIKEEKIDLVVMGTHGRKGLEHMRLGSVTESITRRSPCSVVTIRCKEKALPVKMLKKILVPYDFSEYSDRALVTAKGIAKFYGASLCIFNSVRRVLLPGGSSLETLLTERAEQLEDIKAKLAEEGIVSETDVQTGRPYQRIAEKVAHGDFDLIVMGTHGRNGISLLMLGSVTERVIRIAPCPVYVCKRKG